MVDNQLLIRAAQSNKVLSIIPLIKRIVRAFQTVSAKLGFLLHSYTAGQWIKLYTLAALINMLMKNNSDRIIDLLVKQCDSIDSKITSYHLMGARVIGLGTAIVIGVLALAIKENFILALLLLPFAMFFVLFYWININTWIVGQGSYKRHLENQINNIVGEPIYLWESHIVQHRHTNLSNIMLDIICGVALLACIVASIHATLIYQSVILVVIDILVNTGLAIGLIACIARQKSEFDRVYKEATKVYQNKRNISQEENS